MAPVACSEKPPRLLLPLPMSVVRALPSSISSISQPTLTEISALAFWSPDPGPLSSSGNQRVPLSVALKYACTVIPEIFAV